MLLWVRRTSAASRRSFHLSATGWLYPLLCVSLLIIQAVLFQHHRQPQPEHFQAERVSVPAGLHIVQIHVIEIFRVITRDDAGIPHKHPVGLREHFQITSGPVSSYSGTRGTSRRRFYAWR